MEKTLDEMKAEVAALEQQLQSATGDARTDIQAKLTSARKHVSRMEALVPTEPMKTHGDDGLLLPELREEAERDCEHEVPITYADGYVRCGRCAKVLKEPEASEEKAED
jgi:hypothetical protein